MSAAMLLVLSLVCGAGALEVSAKKKLMPEMAAGGDCGKNKVFEWRGFQTRYTSMNDEVAVGSAPSVLLVHGLFVNADHWRKNVPQLAAAGLRVFAVDLLGNGWSDKPAPMSAQSASGESGRPSFVMSDDIGTAQGGQRLEVEIDQKHPVKGSPYNFYTWSEQLGDFARDVMGCSSEAPAILVCNSIGTISGLQAVKDDPKLFDAVLTISPNFRELHYAEQPALLRPFTTAVQRLLRENGEPLFNALATPSTVRSILESQPYFDKTAVTEELVQALLDPLLTPGASQVVFDTLSYSAGPLPEQLLGSPELLATLVWVCYGDRDPWTPPKRVEALARFANVKKIVALKDVAHCPHDEAPGLVNPIVLDFVKEVAASRSASRSAASSSILR